MPATRFLSVSKVSNTIQFLTKDAAGNILTTESIATQIVGKIEGFVYNRPPLGFPFGTWTNPDDRTPSSLIQTLVTIKSPIGAVIKIFDCDNAVNQTGWQGKTQAALNTAITDLSAML